MEPTPNPGLATAVLEKEAAAGPADAALAPDLAAPQLSSTPPTRGFRAGSEMVAPSLAAELAPVVKAETAPVTPTAAALDTAGLVAGTPGPQPMTASRQNNAQAELKRTMPPHWAAAREHTAVPCTRWVPAAERLAGPTLGSPGDRGT